MSITYQLVTEYRCYQTGIRSATQPASHITAERNFPKRQHRSLKMQRLGVRKVCMYGLMLFIGLSCLYQWLSPCRPGPRAVMVPRESVHYVYDAEHKAYPYDRYMPLIFIGGVPRSGTTLMRAMLDAHPLVRCGEETRVVPRLLGMRSQWAKSPKESKRLREAGLSDEVIDSALAAFILEVIAKHGDPAPRLCNKDPFTLKSSVYLSRLFPNAKFVLMIRDGRAVVHSIVSRRVTISGFDLTSYRKCLEKWNSAMESMYYQCLRLGLDKCLPVYYEQLVLHPREWMERILKFLVIPWNDAVLHHEQFINKPGGVSLSRTERSTDQVIKPVNLEALTKWVHAIPDDVRQDMTYIAPMLSKLGYDPNSYPPSYGDADQTVAENTIHIRNNDQYWRRKSQEIQNMKKVSRSYVHGMARNASSSDNLVPDVGHILDRGLIPDRALEPDHAHSLDQSKYHHEVDDKEQAAEGGPVGQNDQVEDRVDSGVNNEKAVDNNDSNR